MATEQTSSNETVPEPSASLFLPGEKEASLKEPDTAAAPKEEEEEGEEKDRESASSVSSVQSAPAKMVHPSEAWQWQEGERTACLERLLRPLPIPPFVCLLCQPQQAGGAAAAGSSRDAPDPWPHWHIVQGCRGGQSHVVRPSVHCPPMIRANAWMVNRDGFKMGPPSRTSSDRSPSSSPPAGGPAWQGASSASAAEDVAVIEPQVQATGRA